jgi:hypothetical protein
MDSAGCGFGTTCKAEIIHLQYRGLSGLTGAAKLLQEAQGVLFDVTINYV